MSKEQMLERIRTGLQKNRAWLAAEAVRVPHDPPPHVHPPQADLAAQFAGELRRLEGVVHLCADDEAALDVVADLLRRHNAQQVITWALDRLNLPGLEQVLREQGSTATMPRIAPEGYLRAEQNLALDPAPVCISGVDAAIAESGTLAIMSGTERGRLASLIAPVYIALVRREQLVRGLGEAIARLRTLYGADLFAQSSSLTFITGPSRSADIEQTLALGVHGPREIHALIIG